MQQLHIKFSHFYNYVSLFITVASTIQSNHLIERLCVGGPGVGLHRN